MLRFIRPEGKRWSQAQPRGMDYWKTLAEILGKEVIEERDRFMMAMLKPLGIEKGKPFEPDSRQKEILEEAAFVGEAMAKANSFEKRFAGARYRPETQWNRCATCSDRREPIVVGGSGAGPVKQGG